jgi:hypothetical protein
LERAALELLEPGTCVRADEACQELIAGRRRDRGH